MEIDLTLGEFEFIKGLLKALKEEHKWDSSVVGSRLLRKLEKISGEKGSELKKRWKLKNTKN